MHKVSRTSFHLALRARPQAPPLRHFPAPALAPRYSLHALHTIPPLPRPAPALNIAPRRTQKAGLSSQATSFADPSRPELFYHLVDPPTPASASAPAFALSFLPDPPASPTSCTIIGWLPALANDASTAKSGAGLNDFRENSHFRGLLQKAISDTLRDESDEIQTNGALQLQQGWLHIHDERNLPALNRIGDPDDILGSVLVQDSKILPDTYQPMPSYRFCTSDGLMKLTPGVVQNLLAILKKIQHTESRAAS